MARVMGFIDGFNLYHSIRDQIIPPSSGMNPKPHFRQYKWLDLNKLISKFMAADDTLVDVYYFTAIAEWNVDSAQKHKKYIQALNNSGVKSIFGQFKRFDKKCKNCNFKTTIPTEKKTDVNLAVRMIEAAFKDKFDKAFLVSGDTDQAPIVASIKGLFPQKTIGVISPMGRENGALRRIAHIHSTISEEILKDSMFPNPIIVPGKTQIECPSDWVVEPEVPPQPPTSSATQIPLIPDGK